MSKLIANTNSAYEIRSTSYPSTQITAGTFTVTSQPSNKVKVENNEVYFNEIIGTVAGVTDSLGNVQGAPMSATIEPTSEKAYNQTGNVMRLDDESNTVNLAGTTSGGSPTTIPIIVLITDAGQTVTKAK